MKQRDEIRQELEAAVVALDFDGIEKAKAELADWPRARLGELATELTELDHQEAELRAGLAAAKAKEAEARAAVQAVKAKVGPTLRAVGIAQSNLLLLKDRRARANEELLELKRELADSARAAAAPVVRNMWRAALQSG